MDPQDFHDGKENKMVLIFGPKFLHLDQFQSTQVWPIANVDTSKNGPWKRNKILDTYALICPCTGIKSWFL